MDENFICKIIAKLRTQEDISARELSITLGQSEGYINTIENGKSLPSLSMLLNICEYFQITPQEFFCEDVEYPKLLHDLISECKSLKSEYIESMLTLAKGLKE